MVPRSIAVDRWWNGLDLILNASILFPDAPFEARPGIVRRHGFARMESWWPFAGWTSTAGERDAFAASLATAEVALVAVNSAAGDMAAGERGCAAVVGMEEQFRHSILDVLDIGAATGADRFNVLVGNEPHDGDPRAIAAMEEVAVANMTWAAERAAAQGATILLEVLNGVDNPGYLVRSVERAVRWVDRVRSATGGVGIAVLFDVYHLAMLGEDIAGAAARCAGAIGHVQLADSPGRGAPGSGSIDFAEAVDAIHLAGYRGPVALEYRDGSADPFAWMR